MDRFSELTLTNVHRSQSGDYTCVVIVDDDMATGSGALIVTCECMCVCLSVCLCMLCVYVCGCLSLYMCVCLFVFLYINYDRPFVREIVSISCRPV